MRLSPQQLIDITGRVRRKGQAQWFKDYLGTAVPCDERGPIITQAAYEDLVKKQLGVLVGAPETPASRKPVLILRDGTRV
ncbi:MAG: DUF4224 domain-containing protein [Proteobacteria bacterium]|nr:DUF4224 domain-containing protein [Pseudomonadota bacterium]